MTLTQCHWRESRSTIINTGCVWRKHGSGSGRRRHKLVLVDADNQLIICVAIAYYLAFTVLGLSIAAPGPALLALKDNTGSTVSQMGLVFTAR